ncbi:unnamed protein product, partial [Candidula unifasciata]
TILETHCTLLVSVLNSILEFSVVVAGYHVRRHLAVDKLYRYNNAHCWSFTTVSNQSLSRSWSFAERGFHQGLPERNL